MIQRLTAAVLAIALLGVAAVAQPADDSGVRQACAADFQKACPDAKPGNGALKACAKSHFMSFSAPCKSALKAMRARMKQSGQGAAS